MSNITIGQMVGTHCQVCGVKMTRNGNYSRDHHCKPRTLQRQAARERKAREQEEESELFTRLQDGFDLLELAY